jgi:LPXTG-motif cell wall-anchored protein
MNDCALPTTGTGVLPLALAGLVALAIGVGLVLMARRRGVGGGTAVVIALAVAATSLALSDVRTADAAPCPSPAAGTTSPRATTTSTIASSGAAGTTTTQASTGGSTAASTSPTSTSTTTTSSTTSTTEVPLVANLTPRIVGPSTLATGVAGQYTIEIENVGDGPTSGSMLFAVGLTVLSGNSPFLSDNFSSADWNFQGGGGNTESQLFWGSNAGFVLAPGASTTVSFTFVWPPPPGSIRMHVELASGLGGETNASNNNTALTITVS